MSFNIWWTKEKNKIVGQYEEIFILNTFNMLPIAIHMVKSRQEAQKSGQKVQKDKNRVSEKKEDLIIGCKPSENSKI